MDRVRWGMIGCGDVTEVKSGPALQKADGSALVAVMGRNPTKAEDYARRHGVPKWTSDADALIHDPDVDAIYIATPTLIAVHAPPLTPENLFTSRSRWRALTPSARCWMPAARRAAVRGVPSPHPAPS